MSLNLETHKFPHGKCVHKEKDICNKYSKEDLIVKCEEVDQYCEVEQCIK